MEAIIGDKKITVDIENGLITVDGKEVVPDIKETGERSFNVILNHTVYEVELLKIDGKSYDIKVNGSSYPVQLKDKLDLTLERLGIDQSTEKIENEIKAPMPGLILKVMVNEGDQVQKGDSILILEAMKMENVIKSTIDGIVEKIEISVGDSVDKGKILVRF